MTPKKYFTGKKTTVTVLIQGFLVCLFVFSVVFFVWSLMQYNEIMKDKKEDAAYIEQLQDEIEELEYLIEAPLDDAFKVRIAREKLGMCFPDEIIFYTEME
ncbi:MAG: septum formation initiator family protein [Clostridia bacterium]|nr:septum formation initiator family protein [Clostridia bacterium]